MKIEVRRGSAKMSLECDDGVKIPFQDLQSDLERTTIGELLGRLDGIKARVAKTLMLNRTTLVEKAKKYGFPLKK
jgi:DNA-binding NtrC family response regulator